jgi:transposase, IS5 family
MHAPIWAFREALKEHQLTDALFDRLNQALADLGIELKSGQIIDATFVPVPIQRNQTWRERGNPEEAQTA